MMVKERGWKTGAGHRVVHLPLRAVRRREPQLGVAGPARDAAMSETDPAAIPFVQKTEARADATEFTLRVVRRALHPRHARSVFRAR